jgi:hypothetical protein
MTVSRARAGATATKAWGDAPAAVDAHGSGGTVSTGDASTIIAAASPIT